LKIKYTTPKDVDQTKPNQNQKPKTEPNQHFCSYTSRFLNKSKSSAIVTQPSLSTPTASFDEDATGTGDDSDSRYGTGRSRYLAMKERRTRLARSRSSHQFGNDDEDLDEPVSPTTVSPSAYLASRCA